MKIIGMIVVGVALIAGVASRYIFKKSDNVVEEISERIIKDKTGFDVDLSPDTPEKKDKDGKK